MRICTRSISTYTSSWIASDSDTQDNSHFNGAYISWLMSKFESSRLNVSRFKHYKMSLPIISKPHLCPNIVLMAQYDPLWCADNFQRIPGFENHFVSNLLFVSYWEIVFMTGLDNYALSFSSFHSFTKYLLIWIMLACCMISISY